MPSGYPVSIPTTKILVVDDLRENLTATRAALKGCDYEIHEALSGEEALRKIVEHDFAVVLLDVQMPGIDGFETARQMRETKGFETLPIIFVTAIYRTPEFEHQGYLAGAVDYLFKPINIEILRAKISVFVDLQRKSEALRQLAVQERELELLREAVIARDEFLSVASHELTSPLTPLTLQMQTFMNLYQTGEVTKVPHVKLLKMLENSNRQVDRLTKMVYELVDVSRIRYGGVELKREAVELNKLIDGIVSSFEDQIKNVACSIQVHIDGIIYGYWDKFRIEQVLVNLLTNACKYGAGKPIEVNARTEDDYAVINVIDKGIGIKPEDQERIFNRFERAVSSKNFGGLGLGLYISSQFVTLHGGKIFVQSKVSQGSRFTVKLPLRDQLSEDGKFNMR